MAYNNNNRGRNNTPKTFDEMLASFLKTSKQNNRDFQERIKEKQGIKKKKKIVEDKNKERY